LPSVVTQLKEVQRKSKRYKRVVDDNGINSQILVSKEVGKKTEKAKTKEE
jgi:DNA-binding protein H-NS